MLTAFPRFVAFIGRYWSRNALMNVITDKRSRNAGKIWPESLCCRGSERAIDFTTSKQITICWAHQWLPWKKRKLLV